jgi:hypothetical protein
MKISTISLILIFLCFFLDLSAQQQDVNSILDLTLSYRGLSREDVTIPFDTADRINTNQCKLILPIVYNIMKDPLSSMPFLDTVMNYKNLDLNELVYTMFKDINYYYGNLDDKYKFTTDLPSLVDMLAGKIKESHENENKLLKCFTNEELKYLRANLFSLFINSDQNAPENFDIYKLDAAEDSSNVISKRTLDILSKVDTKLIYENSVSDFLFYYQLYRFIDENRNNLHNRKNEKIDDRNVQGDILYYYNKDGIKIVIGGTGKNTYTGKFDLIIDLGGDDAYYIDRDTAFNNNFNCIIDLNGNDYYTTNSKFALGASVFSSGFIFDKEGDDTYKASSINLGASICGIGMIYDESGNDIYSTNSFSEGAGCFGVGMIVDRTGNDFYIANTYSQGFGMTEGIGIIVDNKGNDTYTINPLVLDIGRTNDHFLSMCQGFGFGLRPYYAGGIGIILDGEGNDNYSADIFGQGCSYWYSLGIIVDSSGNDRYNCYHYAHGSGIHFSVGLLKDYEGWDYYSTNWVSQGCGHDYGFGLCWDVKGNDNYSCYGLSQGAGNANGIGILIDESGRDGYLCKDNNCQGYGTPSREYGGIGILLDASGDDFYSSNTSLWKGSGYDSVLSNSSAWGVLNDYYLPDIHSEIAAEQFKIQIDTTKSYSQDELYLFARTLEPRFSLWASYGFNKLAEDSANTAAYLSSKIGSDDIRDIVVIRNFVPVIGYTFSNVLIDKLNQYLNNRFALSEDEVVFSVFLIGESKNLAGKDVLLNLTYNQNVRIRSAAVNALGKMNFTDADSDFKNKVSDRLIELASEKNPRKTYNKDIAFAFKNFKNEKNIPVLIGMMSNNFYGARFNASQDLSDYGDIYSNYLTDEVIFSLSSNKIWFQSFLNSLINLSENKFRNIVEKILNMSIYQDEVINYNLIELIHSKKDRSSDSHFLSWINTVITNCESKVKLKVR